MSLTAVTSTSTEADCQVGGTMQVLILHENECAFMCLWHLTTPGRRGAGRHDLPGSGPLRL
jgi:hypothetical protein